MIKLYLIRHGRQCSANCNVNVPLSEAGKVQAELVGKRLTNYSIQKLYSSELIRAVETAEIINKYLNVPYEKDDELRELCFGDMEGIPNSQVREKFKNYFLESDKFLRDIPYPGGESGEDAYKRGMPALMRIVEKAKDENIENIAVVTHGGMIRSILSGIMGQQFCKRLLLAKSLENCSITELNYREREDETGYFTIERFNDYAHIEIDEKLLRKYF